MRSEVYNFLVNKRPGICYRYHKVHDGAAGIQKIISWIYLTVAECSILCIFLPFFGENSSKLEFLIEKNARQ